MDNGQWYTDQLTNWQTDRLTNWLTDQQTDWRQTNWLTDRLTDRLTNRQTDRQAGRETDRKTYYKSRFFGSADLSLPYGWASESQFLMTSHRHIWWWITCLRVTGMSLNRDNHTSNLIWQNTIIYIFPTPFSVGTRRSLPLLISSSQQISSAGWEDGRKGWHLSAVGEKQSSTGYSHLCWDSGTSISRYHSDGRKCPD